MVKTFYKQPTKSYYEFIYRYFKSGNQQPLL